VWLVCLARRKLSAKQNSKAKRSQPLLYLPFGTNMELLLSPTLEFFYDQKKAMSVGALVSKDQRVARHGLVPEDSRIFHRHQFFVGFNQPSFLVFVQVDGPRHSFALFANPYSCYASHHRLIEFLKTLRTTISRTSPSRTGTLFSNNFTMMIQIHKFYKIRKARTIVSRHPYVRI